MTDVPNHYGFLHHRVQSHLATRGLSIRYHGNLRRRRPDVRAKMLPWVVVVPDSGNAKTAREIVGEYPTLESVALAYGLTLEPYPPRGVSDEAFLAALESSNTVDELATALGMERASARKRLNEELADGRLNDVRLICGQTKLSPMVVREIREMARAGSTNVAIAAKYELHTSTVWAIVNRYTWRHVR